MIDVINFKQMKFSKIFFLSVVSFSAFLGINSSYAGTCVETSPGVNRCYSSSGGSSVTIETSPGVFRYYGTDANGNSTSDTYIQW